jgi:type II secretory pathway pseudopilin PulG
MVEASFIGLIRTILIIVGVIVLLRFLGQMMNARRNMAEQEAMNRQSQKLQDERNLKAKNLGKTSILGNGKSTSGDVEDVDFVEID